MFQDFLFGGGHGFGGSNVWQASFNVRASNSNLFNSTSPLREKNYVEMNSRDAVIYVHEKWIIAGLRRHRRSINHLESKTLPNSKSGPPWLWANGLHKSIHFPPNASFITIKMLIYSLQSDVWRPSRRSSVCLSALVFWLTFLGD